MFRPQSCAVNCKRLTDIAGRGGQIGLRERHYFRTRRGARCVQHHRCVARLCIAALRRRLRVCAGLARHEREAACALIKLRHQVDHTHAKLAGGVHRRRAAALLDDERAGVQIRQVELELVSAIGRVERRAGHAAGAGHEAGRHLGAVGQHDGHALVATDAQTVQAFQRGVDQAAQCAVAQGLARRRRDGGCRIGARGQQFFQGVLHRCLVSSCVHGGALEPDSSAPMNDGGADPIEPRRCQARARACNQAAPRL